MLLKRASIYVADMHYHTVRILILLRDSVFLTAFSPFPLSLADEPSNIQESPPRVGALAS